MAGRTTRKPKETASTRAAAKPLREAAPKKARKKSTAGNVSAAKSANGKAGVVKRKRAKAKPADLETANALLIEQNEALRAELDHANARITQLEELNKNVVNRIDWVIDSLQSVLTAKR
jgi:glutathione synthase/RimK-type ligase-like ATP-grasp enzyme